MPIEGGRSYTTSEAVVIKERRMTGDEVLRAAVDAAQARWAARLIAVYAIGSLAHGGFIPEVSDVDVAFLITDPLAPDDAAGAAEVTALVARSSSTPLASRLSVFWGSPESLRGGAGGGRFPAYDRLDLLQAGRLLWGTDVRDGIPTPTHRELAIESASFALRMLASPTIIGSHTVNATALLRRPESLLDRGSRDMTKLVLFPVRFLYTCRTGRSCPTDQAIADFLDGQGEGPEAHLVRAAHSWREHPFTDRDAALALLNAGLVPLYVTFIDDYVTCLRAFEEGLLVDRLLAWRDALTER